MSGWQRIKAKLATPTMRRLLRRPDAHVIRAAIASRFLHGDGIEVGALNVPLPMPAGARVRYVDCEAPDALRSGEYSMVSRIQTPDLIADIETLDGIDDASVDFVVVNHVLEHVENPLRALVAISRVLRAGGIAFITLPDKRFTFDKRRAVTPLWHVVRDFEDGPEWSRRDHYVDWLMHVERTADVAARVEQMERTSRDIHFHVWDFAAMAEMFDYAAALPNIDLTIIHAQQNRGEAVWVLRKP